MSEKLDSSYIKNLNCQSRANFRDFKIRDATAVRRDRK